MTDKHERIAVAMIEAGRVVKASPPKFGELIQKLIDKHGVAVLQRAVSRGEARPA